MSDGWLDPTDRTVGAVLLQVDVLVSTDRAHEEEVIDDAVRIVDSRLAAQDPCDATEYVWSIKTATVVWPRED